jgi:hypothetical protein
LGTSLVKAKRDFRIAVKPFPLNAVAARRCSSHWRPERLLDAVRKRIDHGAFLVTFVCPEEPAVNECLDLAAVKFDREAAIAGPTSCPATTHSACGGFPCNLGLHGYTVRDYKIMPIFSVTSLERYCTRWR